MNLSWITNSLTPTSPTAAVNSSLLLSPEQFAHQQTSAELGRQLEPTIEYPSTSRQGQDTAATLSDHWAGRLL